MRCVVLISAVLGGLFWQPTSVLAQPFVSSGNVTTIAGSANGGFSGDGGLATAALLNYPQGTAIGRDGALYFTDRFNYRIRRVDAVTGTISTVAGNGISVSDNPAADNTGDGGPATNASFADVWSVAVDPARNILYVADANNDRVRQ